MSLETIVANIDKRLLIDGAWRPAVSRRTFEVQDPSTQQVLCVVADAGVEDALAALDAASERQASWRQTPPRQRGDILRRAYEIITDRTEDLALLMTLESGKPQSEARSEVAYAAEFFRWFSEEAVRIGGGYATSPDGSGRIVTMRQPVGPCLLITPWNFPLAMGTRKIGPAVAAGCTMVIKPAEQTPLSTLALASILMEAGLPAGVLNVITTSEPSVAFEPLIGNQAVRKLSFTGSTPVGQHLLRLGADNVIRTSLELGGNAPFLVFEDTDIDVAVDGAMLAKMRNAGQSCIAANRFLVHASVVDDFASRLAERMGRLQVGRGTRPEVQVGPLIDAQARTKVAALVAEAVDHGARVLAGGRSLPGDGHFYEPTVLTGVPEAARLTTTEIFGPVAPISTFETEEEAIRGANATQYGLVAYLYTNDLNRAIRVSERIETGMVGINQGIVSNAAAPFGGIKQSGLGREGGSEGVNEFLETKYLALSAPT